MATVSILGKKFKSQKEAANFFNVSTAMISAIKHGKKEISRPMAEKCGYKKIVKYKRIVRYESIDGY